MGTGGTGRALVVEMGLGCFLAGQEGWQKSGGRRWSRRIGGDFRAVGGRRKIDRVGGSREDAKVG